MAKEKIAVLGGGCGAMSAVWALTSEPGWQKKYDITVYQLGWRLGGKGASGRGPDGRIQEHGLHIWMGFYENAFRVMRQAFSELQGEPRVYQSVEDAFKPQSKIGVMENLEDGWEPWVIPFPKLPGQPGDGTPRQHSSVLDMVLLALKDIIGMIEELLGGKSTPDTSVPMRFAKKSKPTLSGKASAWAKSHLGELEDSVIGTAHKLFHKLPTDWHSDKDSHEHALEVLENAHAELELHEDHHKRAKDLEKSNLLRRLGIVLDLGKATAKAFLWNYSKINKHGLNVFDDLDLQDFFKKYGAKKKNYEVASSAGVRAFYDLVFGYEGGDPQKPNFAASAALRSILSILLLYKNSVFMKMRAGMGDTIFAPLHKALEKRGVKFEFFHRVTDMTLDDKGGSKSVGSIKFAVQATVKSGSYNPYVEVEGLDCWPQAPLVDQLVEGDEILKGPDGKGTEGWDGNWKGYDLEDFWTGWTDPASKTLTKGADFDRVILGIPPASHPFICPDLVASSADWQNMVQNVSSVRTQAMQLWMKSPIFGLGWQHGSSVVDAFQQPMNTWADMTHLINRESWPVSASLGSIAYFCGPMEGGIPDPDKKDVTEKETAKVLKTGNNWLSFAPGAIWPDAVDASGALDEGELVKDVSDTGSGHLYGQYWRANVSPSERYVMSKAGTAKDRLPADGSGLSNLIFAGDWTDNTFNAGCVEASVMSGLFASNALAGWPKKSQIETYW